MELLSRGNKKEFWTIDLHRERSPSWKSRFVFPAAHQRGESASADHYHPSNISKSLIMIANIYAVSYCTPGTVTLFHLVVTKIL